MVVAALLVRSRINDRNERRHTVLRLACVTELESVCDAIKDGAGGRVDLTVGPAGTTEAGNLPVFPSGSNCPALGVLDALMPLTLPAFAANSGTFATACLAIDANPVLLRRKHQEFSRKKRGAGSPAPFRL